MPQQIVKRWKKEASMHSLSTTWRGKGFESVGSFLLDAASRMKRQQHTEMRRKFFNSYEGGSGSSHPPTNERLRLTTLDERLDGVWKPTGSFERTGQALPANDPGPYILCSNCQTKFFARVLPADCPDCKQTSSNLAIVTYLTWVDRVLRLRPLVRRLAVRKHPGLVVPLEARWTKLSRDLVSAAALQKKGERFEEREDHFIVFRILRRHEIDLLIRVTQKIDRNRKDTFEMEHTTPDSAHGGIDPSPSGVTKATTMYHNQIYLLHLDRGAPKQTLKGRLELASLDDPDLQFEFLAHNCQHSTRTDKIVVNDVEMNIPGSLGDALRRFRRTDSPRSLWLDAICIDGSSHPQSPEIESWSLVIRYRANALLVWLGEHHDFGAAAFRRFVNTILSIGKMIHPSSALAASSRLASAFSILGGIKGDEMTFPALEAPMPTDIEDGSLQSVVAAKQSGSRVVVGETEADYETTIKALRWMKSFGHEVPSVLADWKI
ncbi:hypothetical protein D0867_04622 [Hortaea werneckii]|uniref:Uncharacterized protein n=1 Tax=Hortaea werneckii TaxID=91943 RepID=A0A3M6ZWD5_HORWE|nr:hypothetical protein D0867_04622 [Hortaea werneckii]